ncbi:MAG: sigma-70 family RNA polymerase sigma factor [Tyzzerella sp.]|nr:sigma-70 family RNA polymerase sigma factor [Tyzzerella sp.]
MEHKTQRDEMFDAAYESYAEDIYRVCLHLTENEKDAQDIAQQTFVNFYGRSENVDSDCTFAYLVCEAKNLACKHQKNLGQRR